MTDQDLQATQPIPEARGQPDTPSRHAPIRARRLLPRWGERGWATAGALGLAAPGAALFRFADTPLWWFGGALLVAAVAVAQLAWGQQVRSLWAAGKRPVSIGPLRVTPSWAILESTYLALIAVVALTMMQDALWADRPVSHDHVIHFVRAWYMHEHLLPRGQLFGWSHDWFAGNPVGYLYPIGTDLWVNAVWALSLGALSMGQAYAVAFWLFHLLFGYAVYRLGRLVGGPHVGLVAALLAITDLSEFRFGGWAYTIVYGVWPQSLSLVFALLAICRLPGLLQHKRLRDMAAFGVWMGLALITHPVHLLVLPLMFAVAFVAAAVADDVRAASGMWRVAVAYALSLLVGAVWLVPFLATRSQISPTGMWWDTTYEMGVKLLDLTALEGSLGYVLAFGVLGVLIMLKTRRFALWFAALMTIFIPFVCSSTLIDEFHLPSVSKAFSRVQFVRMSTVVKPFWFTVAAYCLVAVIRSARSLAMPSSPSQVGNSHQPAALRSATARPYGRTVAVALFLGFVLVPVLVPAGWAFWTRHVNKTLLVESQRPHQDERRQLADWMRRKLPKDGFYRVGVFTGHNHHLMDLATEFDRPLYKRGFTPCSTFRYKMRTREVPVLKAVNLRFAISKKPLPPEEFELLAGFGILKIYRFKQWQPQPFKVIEGSGDVTLERFDEEEIVLRAAPGSSGRLRLNVSYFPRWHAYRDGKPVRITTTRVKEEPKTTGFMTVRLAPGRYRFVFERAAIDHVGLPLSVLGLLIAAALTISDRRRLGWGRLAVAAARLSGWAQRRLQPALDRSRVALFVAAGLGLAAAGVVLSQLTPPIALEGPNAASIRRVRFDFLERISRARVQVEYENGHRPCERQRDRFVCPDEEGNLDITNYVAPYPAVIEEYQMVRCIRARPVQDGRLSLIYSRVPAGQALVGYYGVEHVGRLLTKERPVRFSIMIDGHIAYEEKTEKDTQLHWFYLPMDPPDPRRRVDVAFSVKTEIARKRFFCFHAQMVDF